MTNLIALLIPVVINLALLIPWQWDGDVVTPNPPELIRLWRWLQ